jgi:hypothetical protein
MSSGYFKFFILDNYDKLYINRDSTYIEKFKIAEKNKQLRLA